LAERHHEVLGDVLQNDAMLNLGTSVAILIPSDATVAQRLVLRGSRRALSPPPARCAVRCPFWPMRHLRTGLVVWGLVYPLILLASATYVFSRRDCNGPPAHPEACEG